MSGKPVVEYDSLVPHEILYGVGAIVRPFNHPSDFVSNKKNIKTSAVLKYEGNGCFETLHTLYIPRRV